MPVGPVLPLKVEAVCGGILSAKGVKGSLEDQIDVLASKASAVSLIAGGAALLDFLRCHDRCSAD